MSIQIIDNFELGTAKPLDNRFVVGPSSFYQSKDMIPHKYVGLRVWDLNFGLPFVWIGGTWSNENVGSAVVTGGVGGYIPKFLGSGTSNTLSSSIIYEFQSGGTVNIGINTPSPAAKLDVNGSFKASSIETANGFAISNLDASKITNGTLTLNRLQNGTTGQILVAGAIATWQSNTTIRVGSALGLAISSDISTNSTFDLLFSRISEIYPDSLSPSSYYVKSAQSGTKRIQFNPSSGQLLIGGGASSDGTATLPVYSFSSDTNTGIYRPGNDALSISLGGVETIKFSNTESVLSLNRISGNINFDMNARVGNSFLNTTYTITLRQEVGSGVNNFIIRSSYKTFNFDDGELSFPPTQRLKLTSSELIIGTDNVGSAFIRMSGVGSAVGTLGTLRPTYSFWGADNFGMGRDGSSIYISASGNRIVDFNSNTGNTNTIRIFSPDTTSNYLDIVKWVSTNAGGWTCIRTGNTSTHFEISNSIETNLAVFTVKSSVINLTGTSSIATNAGSVISIGTNPDVNYKLKCVANGSNGGVLFATSTFTTAGHSSTIYIGDNLHYMTVIYGTGLRLRTNDYISLFTGGDYERLRISSDITTYNIGKINLGNITGSQQTFLNVQDGIGIEGNWFSINSTWGGTGFKAAKNLVSDPGPSGFFIKIQYFPNWLGFGSTSPSISFNSTYGLNDGNSKSQFTLRGDTALKDFQSTGFTKPVFIDQYSILQTGNYMPVQTAKAIPFVTGQPVTTLDGSANIWFRTSSSITGINFPNASDCTGARIVIMNQLPSAITTNGFYGYGNAPVTGTSSDISAYSYYEFFSNGTNWYYLNSRP